MSSCAAIVSTRLPKKTFITPGDVASALDVAPRVVYGWIDDGSLDAMNISDGKSRPTYKISRESAERLIAKLTRGGK